jgi:hypothetical protein
LDWYIRKFGVDRGFYVGGTYPSNNMSGSVKGLGTAANSGSSHVQPISKQKLGPVALRGNKMPVGDSGTEKALYN